jgi:hypothetical protein
MNCGGCGTVCPHDSTTASTCVNSVCQSACAPDYWDLDGDPKNGCEYFCHKTSDIDFPDSPGFVDANCDGFDGELKNGIFVSTTGDDANLGLTPSTPKKTFGGASGAILALLQNGKRDLYVASGTFTGPVELGGYAQMAVAGGYDPATWKRSLSNITTIAGGNPALKLDGSSGIEIQLLRVNGDNATATSPGLAAYGAWIKDSTSIKLTAVTVTAGNGFSGATMAGTVTNGNPGSNGGDGQKAADKDVDGHDYSVCQIVGDNYLPLPGLGATNAQCSSAQGGNGGNPGRQLSQGSGTSTVSLSQAGNASPAGSAGGLGVPENLTSPGALYDGVAGTAGTPGMPAQLAAIGTLGPVGWTPGDGANGSAGTVGKGGGGGGGGAGGWVHWQIPFSGIDAWCQGYGSGGGGGGSGGCGGTGGFGGTGGGASIGILITGASTVTGAGGTSINVGKGGDGGAGTAGGTGGSAGLGGTSPDPDASLTQASYQTRGGRGGAGGKGGDGSAGTGGAGGMAYGVARSAASTVTGALPVGTTGTGGAAGGGPRPGPQGSYSQSVVF